MDPSLRYCAFIGRITKIKRPDRFLDVVAKLRGEGSNLHFIVAGAGDLLDYCKERSAKEDLPIIFLGWRDDVETVLAASDLVLLTSDNEGTPLSLIQAGMANLPIVATNVGSISEIIVDGETGFLTDLSTASLAESVTKLISSNPLMEEMGRKAYEYTTNRYGVERLVRDHEELYKKLLSDRARS